MNKWKFQSLMLGIIFRDGEGAGGGGGGGGGEGGGNAEKKFTQDDVNRFLAEDRRKAQQKNQELVTQLTALKEGATLTQKERDELQARIEQLQNEHLTKEEQAQREFTKKLTAAETTLKTAQAEVDAWRSRYTDATIEREITDAAVQHDAFSPTQIVALLRQNTRLVEELDGGKPTGRFGAKVKFSDIKDGQPITLELTVAEAVKRMTELPERFGNLFKNKATGGVGGGNSPGSDSSGKPPVNDPAAYREWRKKHKLT